MKKTGTREWAAHNVNCVKGCSHDCRYCYAAEIADRFGRRSRDAWHIEEINRDAVRSGRRLSNGIVMFPTTHDITPNVYFACETVLLKLLQAGNRVLIVSKPHFECIRKLTTVLFEWRSRIEFRFTIGSRRDSILSYWEPNAPAFSERLGCLEHAAKSGFATSVSIEPMLDAVDVYGLLDEIAPFVTETIWIGKMREVKRRVRIEDDRDFEMVEMILKGQTDEKIVAMYNNLCDNESIKWKDSIMEVVDKNRRERMNE